jgi:hypothetical protein
MVQPPQSVLPVRNLRGKSPECGFLRDVRSQRFRCRAGLPVILLVGQDSDGKAVRKGFLNTRSGVLCAYEYAEKTSSVWMIAFIGKESAPEYPGASNRRLKDHFRHGTAKSVPGSE